MAVAEYILAPEAQTAEPLHRGRIDGLDVLRGLVMVIMALDHTRDFMHAGSQGIDVTNPDVTNPVLFATRWITHLCAPTFVLLAGVSAWLRAQRSTPGELSGFLLTRGLWLIVLELTIVGFGFTFVPGMLFLQVIWVIGASMVLLAGFSRLPGWVVLALGVALIAGHDLLDATDPKTWGAFAPLYAPLFGSFTLINSGPFHGVLLYALLPWTGVMFLGFGLGSLFRLPRARRNLALVAVGAGMTLLFVALRVANAYGDPVPDMPEPTAAKAVEAFLRVSKYPPSLDYVLATVGPMLALLPLLDAWRGKAMEVFRTFGRVPLFYYVLHIYLLHGVALIIGLMQGASLEVGVTGLNPKPPFGVSLAVVYAIWIAAVVALYPLCRWFEGVRQRRHDWWLSYL